MYPSDNTIPAKNCSLCTRLVEYRNANQLSYSDWWNAPVPPWGNIQSELLIVGLAPGVKGANRTGRPFTGDYAGYLLYETLIKYGFARGNYQATPEDGLSLVNCRILNAVRCVPPANKPTSEEEKNCRHFLRRELQRMPQLKIILALGVVAHKNVLACYGLPVSKNKFTHGKMTIIGEHLQLVDSYHVSRYNTNTGVLTPEMFDCVVQSIRIRLPLADYSG